ncbi:MAG: DUF1700 domain-containing protein [Oscillospiraceae bacterium]
MNKVEYLAELKAQLSSLPPDERDAAIKYYEEFFEDAGKENEENVIKDLGSAKELASTIISEQNFAGKSSSDYVPAKIITVTKAEEKSPSVFKIVSLVLLIIFASPFLLALLAIIFALGISVLAVIFSVIVSFVAVALSLGISGIFCIVTGIMGIFMNPSIGFLAIGAGFVLFGIGLLLTIPIVLMCSKLIPATIRGIVNIFSRIFHRGKKQ